MHTQNGVVRLNHGSRHLGTRPHCETKLAFLAVVHRESFKHQTSQARTRSSSTPVEHHKSLQSRAIVCKLANTVEHKIDNFLANRVMTTSEIVCSVFLPR